MASLGFHNIAASALDPAASNAPLSVAALIGADGVNSALTIAAFDDTTEANVLTDPFVVPTGTASIKIYTTYRAVTAPGSPVTDERFRWYARRIDTGAALSWAAAVDLDTITVAADVHPARDDGTYTVATLGLTAGADYQLAFSRKIGGSLTGNLNLFKVTLEFLDT